MELEISYNDQQKGIELLFDQEPPKPLAERLVELGFKEGFRVPLKWTAKRHPAYATYAGELKEALLKKRDYLSVQIHPSFKPTEANIDHNKFSYVTISYQEEGNTKQKNFVVFDSFKKVAEVIATQYGKQQYKDAFISVDASPRKNKRKVRKLFADGNIITESFDTVKSKDKEMTWVVYSSTGKIDSFQISEEKAKAYIQRRPEFSRDKMRYEQMEKEKAFALWDKENPKDESELDSKENFHSPEFEIIDKKRTITPVYHGTCVPFKQFDKQFLGAKSGDIPSYLGHHFTHNKKLASTLFANDPYEDSYEHCRYIQAKLNVKKTLKTTEEILVKTILRWGLDKGIIKKQKEDLTTLLELPYWADERKEKSLVTALQSDKWVKKGEPLIDYEKLAIRYLNEVLKPQGFDSILYQNAMEWAHEKRYDWIVFDEKQIEQQDVIPVSKKPTPLQIAENLLDTLTELEIDADEEESDATLLAEARLALDEVISSADEAKIIAELKRIIREISDIGIQTKLIQNDVKKAVKETRQALGEITTRTLNKREKVKILIEFGKFHEKRKVDFPEVAISEDELPIQFSSWLRHHHPELLSQKDSIWTEYETVKGFSNQLTNENGVYTEETAGKNYETIDIPIPKSAKYTVSISMVKDENGAYRMATDTHKQFGDFSGHSSPVTSNSKAYPTKKEALTVALKEIQKRVQKEIQSRDSILDNEPKKKKLLEAALQSVIAFAGENDINLSSEETSATYRLGQGWSTLDEKTITAFQQLINNHPDKLEVTPEPSHLEIEGNDNPKIASVTIRSDRDKIYFQAYQNNTLLISSLTPLEEAVTYGGSTMPKTKLKKAIQYMIKYPERLGAENKNEAVIIKELEAALWNKEDEAYPVNQVIIKGVAYNQSRLRKLLLDKLKQQPLVFQLDLISTLSGLFRERRPYAGSNKQIDALTKSEEKKEKELIRSYVDDIIVDHDLWQIQATDGEAKKMEDGVMAWLISQLYETSEKLVDKPSKPKQMAKKTGKINQHELNVMIEDFIVEKDSEDHVYTEEDKNYLKQYTGGGGLIKQGAKGKGILYEYFTPDAIVQKMWGLAIKYGYTGGDVLEPSCGIGNFIKYAPADAKVVGYEINPYSNRIAEILYPHATIYQQPLETLFFAGNVHLKDDFGDTRYDLVIGNPPYGEFSGKWAGMGEKKWTGATEYDQYFITRGLDLLRENGLLIFIIPSTFLNNGAKYNKLKEKIAAKAELIDAYRLPERVFKTTDIGTDIVVFKRK